MIPCLYRITGGTAEARWWCTAYLTTACTGATPRQAYLAWKEHLSRAGMERHARAILERQQRLPVGACNPASRWRLYSST